MDRSIAQGSKVCNAVPTLMWSLLLQRKMPELYFVLTVIATTPGC
jgi:hypothetical protein